jgi:hypothetical protein
MKMEELFDGIDSDRQARYEAELVERFGESAQAHIDEGKRKMQSWTRADADGFMAEWATIAQAYTGLLDRGVAADAPEALELTDRHYRWICRSWTPNRESYTGLGELYVSEDFAAQFVDAGHAEYVRDAMAAYARARL